MSRLTDHVGLVLATHASSVSTYGENVVRAIIVLCGSTRGCFFSEVDITRANQIVNTAHAAMSVENRKILARRMECIGNTLDSLQPPMCACLRADAVDTILTVTA